MHPVLWSYRSFRLPTYGVLLAIAILAAIWTVVRLGRREGLDTRRLFDLSTWLVLVGLVGAKLLMILTSLDYYLRFPQELFSWDTFRAGGAFYGGFLAAVIFAFWYLRLNRWPMGKTLDVYAPALALGHAIGRIGCFAAGCDYGKPTALALGVTFTHPYSHELVGVPLGVPLHPTQLYESLANLVIFALLLVGFRYKKYDGQIFLWYLLMYGVARFTVEFFRGDEDRGFVWGHLLSVPQLMALLAAATALILMIHHRGQHAALARSHSS